MNLRLQDFKLLHPASPDAGFVFGAYTGVGTITIMDVGSYPCRL
jgi:hypothetical protein